MEERTSISGMMSRLTKALFERMGLNAFVSGDYRAAEKWFRRLEVSEPDSIRVLRNLGVSLLAQGDTAGAEYYFRREERCHGFSFHRHSALADLAYAKGDRYEALKRYEAACAEPDAPRVGSVARSFSESRIAICRDERAFSRSRVAEHLFYEAGKHREGGDLHAALKIYEETASLDPTHWPALNNAGSILLNELNDPAGALAFFERALVITDSVGVMQNAAMARAAVATPGFHRGRTRRSWIPSSRSPQ